MGRRAARGTLETMSQHRDGGLLLPLKGHGLKELF